MAEIRLVASIPGLRDRDHPRVRWQTLCQAAKQEAPERISDRAGKQRVEEPVRVLQILDQIVEGVSVMPQERSQGLEQTIEISVSQTGREIVDVF